MLIRSIICVIIISSTRCNLNLFLSTSEMKKLLGLEKELFYVRDGALNKYAMGFLIPVPSYVNSLQFTWYSSHQLHYSISTSSSSSIILPNPSLNISSSGSVPQVTQIWSVSLKCSGLEPGEVVVTITVDITDQDNVTSLVFKRKKTCHMYTVADYQDYSAIVKDDDAGDKIPTHVVFFAGVGGGLFVLVLVLSLVIGTWLRSTSQQKHSGAGHETSKNTEYTALPPPPDMVQNHSALSQVSNTIETNTRRPSYMTSTLLPSSTAGQSRDSTAVVTSDLDWSRDDHQHNNTAVSSPPIEQLLVDRLNLVLGDLLMEGTFGRVYQGRLSVSGSSRDVMVKTVMMGSSESQAVKLINDGSLLYPVHHKHVLPLLATTSDGSSPMMIYEYLNPGNMKKWLTECHQPVSTHQCVTIGLQLLSALKHIHKHHIVHKDVAARNCYLTPNLSIKLSDPALSKDLFPNDYHCLGDNDNRPVKWMSVETISGGDHSTASDVWSWGVTMWEVLTRAQQPFPDVDPFEMETYLMEGFRLHQPVNCPDQLYSVIVSCWAHSPHHRASVSTLFSHLQDFNTQLKLYV